MKVIGGFVLAVGIAVLAAWGGAGGSGALRRRLKMSQGELARRMECSAMSVSRWERGLQKPTADYYIQLGKLGGKEDSWLFWERAGLHMADVARALPAGNKPARPLAAVPRLENAVAGLGTGATLVSAGNQMMVALPLLRRLRARMAIVATGSTALTSSPPPD